MTPPYFETRNTKIRVKKILEKEVQSKLFHLLLVHFICSNLYSRIVHLLCKLISYGRKVNCGKMKTMVHSSGKVNTKGVFVEVKCGEQLVVPGSYHNHPTNQPCHATESVVLRLYRPRLYQLREKSKLYAWRSGTPAYSRNLVESVTLLQLRLSSRKSCLFSIRVIGFNGVVDTPDTRSRGASSVKVCNELSLNH